MVSDYRSRHDDSNGPRIVKIGAILAMFAPFEVSRKVSAAQASSKSSSRIQKIDAHVFLHMDFYQVGHHIQSFEKMRNLVGVVMEASFGAMRWGLLWKPAQAQA